MFVKPALVVGIIRFEEVLLEQLLIVLEVAYRCTHIRSEGSLLLHLVIDAPREGMRFTGLLEGLIV